MESENSELARILVQCRREILAEWEGRVRRELPAARKEPENALRDSIPEFIKELAEKLSRKGGDQSDLRTAREHGEFRARKSEFPLDQIIREYGILRDAIFDQLEVNTPLTAKQRAMVLALIDAGVAQAGTSYSETQKSKVAEAAAVSRAAEKRFREAIDRLDHAVAWELEPASGKIVFVGRRAESLFGYDVRRWTDEPDFFVSHVHPEDQLRVREMIQSGVRTGKDMRCEHRFKTKHRGYVWVQTGFNVDRDESGKIQLLRFLSVDIDPFKRAAEENERILSQLRGILSGGPEGLALVDREMKFIRVNARMGKFLGLPPEKPVGKSVNEIFGPVNEGIEGKVAAVLKTGNPEHDIQVDHSRRNYIVCVFPVLSAEKGVVGAGISFSDVTSIVDSEKRERAAREAAERQLGLFKAIMASIPDALYVGDAKGINIVNDAGLKQLGFDSKDDLTCDLSKLSEIVESRDPETGRKLSPDEIPFGMALSGKTVVKETVIRHLKSGRDRIIRSSAAPIEMGGKIVGAVAINTDATESRAAEAALKSAARSRQLLADTGLALSASSLDINEALRSLASVIVPRLADWCIIDIGGGGEPVRRVAVKHRDPELNALSRVLLATHPDLEAAGGSAVAIKTGQSFMVCERDGESPDKFIELGTSDPKQKEVIRQFGVASYMTLLLHSRGRMVGVMTLVKSGLGDQFSEEDFEFGKALADRAAVAVENARLFTKNARDLELIKEERTIRERLISIITHDLRGPLTAIKTSAQLVRRFSHKEDTRERSLLRIEQSADRATRMVEDLLDASRIQAGEKLTVRYEPVDLRAMVGDLIEELSAAFGDRFDLEPGGPARGYWGSDLLRRAVSNLLVNAVKYGEHEGRVKVKLQARDGRVLISVNNKGQPIPAEEIGTLFQPFRRASTAGSEGGWGLGLALVRGAAEAHGGRVWVESKGAAGTTFFIEIPRDSRP